MDLLATKKNLTNPVVQQDAQTLAKNFQCFFLIAILQKLIM